MKRIPTTVEMLGDIVVTGVPFYKHTIHTLDGKQISCQLYGKKDDMILYYEATPKTEDEVKAGEHQVPYGMVPVSNVSYISINE